MTEKKKRTQMTFDISPEIHHKIKIIAAIRNISINLFAQRALIKEISRYERNDDEKREIV